MLFNSYSFLFAYLPITLVLFFTLARRSHILAAAFLALASLFFYAWWNPRYLVLLIGSITFNYLIGSAIAHRAGTNRAKLLMYLGVSVNLLTLGIFKYTNLLVKTANSLSDTQLFVTHVVLPLGISFFTFTQLAFLVDTYRGLASEYNPIHYLLFVTYFPHLIAGPILHHKQMMPQFADKKAYKFSSENFAIGAVFFAIGLSKKVLIADNISLWANRLFDGANLGMHASFVTAWMGTFAYAFQIYFDFSGYCDMAIGLSKFFGIDLPLNFYSPYKSVDIVEFWRRWHMTLSQFLRDYLYIPLGGNKRGKCSRYQNLIITMLLGGLWHGANWTFVIWGGLHGIYLVINHLWRGTETSVHVASLLPGRLVRWLSAALTFLAVSAAWVFFRADSFRAASSVFNSLVTFRDAFAGVHPEPSFWMISAVAAAIIWLAPNASQISEALKIEMASTTRRSRVLVAATAVFVGVIASVGILQISAITSQFIYFQF